MGQIVLSFFAGVLTVAAPCILPLLPVIVGGSALQGHHTNKFKKTGTIIGSLVVSVLIFSLLFKATTVFLGINVFVWQVISGGIIIIVGMSFLYPKLWETVALKSGFYNTANSFFANSSRKNGFIGDVALGAALGPVFNSCSPTYALIIAGILPVSFLIGFINLAAYSIGLGLALFIISLGGQKIVAKMNWLAAPDSYFRKIMGLVFLAVGFGIIFGLDKTIQEFILTQGWYDPIAEFEQRVGL